MVTIPSDLPTFEHPPVVEVALGAQFAPCANIDLFSLGKLRQQFVDRYELAEFHTPLEPVLERFVKQGVPSKAIQFKLFEQPPIPRTWLLRSDGRELIQVQPDRFIQNWRKAGDDDAYPRFPYIRSCFRDNLGRFAAFVDQLGAAPLEFNQCEVTYVNHLVAGEGFSTFGELEKVVSPWNGTYSDSFLQCADEISLKAHYIMPNDAGEPIGKLHVEISPAYRTVKNEPIFILKLVARGLPMGDGLDGVMRFLDFGRAWVVKGFVSFTSEKMHQFWGLKR